MPMAKVGDISLEYYVEGEGPPLLMIMGWMGQANVWGERFLHQLRPHFQIIRFSNRGTGQTDKPSGDVTIALMAGDAAGLLQEMGIQRAHVLGISMGGMIAQELALNHPQAVRGLVLGCTNCGPAHSVAERAEVRARLEQSQALAPMELLRQLLTTAVAPEFLRTATGEFWGGIAAGWMAAPTPWETIGRHFQAIQSFDTYDRLPRIQAPTLIVHGDQDLLVPVENAEILGERIKNSRAEILPGAGHMFFWEKPEESAGAIVEFLSSVPAPA